MENADQDACNNQKSCQQQIPNTLTSKIFKSQPIEFMKEEV
jgi:hypothetical protein